ncbi:hypothetical protein HNQ74_000304 [Bartonella doshiae]|uniref:Uncharacterized protein n=2 Tax=Bartonella doshiae TaxID=33044 RepID=A0A380ZF60_BARDO|nr:hypothetical protein MCS_01238 [Bartonella doshiae NCTC 12862 = ATCC 700133]MBB6158898.1 hypothetical protein [Bartonella doshiae]SUV45599.1 Uncharacterised protein [Bartonella doshiae]
MEILSAMLGPVTGGVVYETEAINLLCLFAKEVKLVC